MTTKVSDGMTTGLVKTSNLASQSPGAISPTDVGKVVQLDSTGAIPSVYVAGASSGKVLQVVEGTVSAATQVGDGTTYYTTSATSSTGSECGTGAITPSAASSKVKVDFSMYWGSDFADSYKYLFLFKGTTLLKTIAFGYGQARGNESFVYVDSPSTTSETTYSVRFIQDSTASYTMYANRDESGSGVATLSTGDLVLSEIAA